MPRTVLPVEIEVAIAALRKRIRRYVLLEGLALVVVLATAYFWGSYLLDWAYFAAVSQEPPVWVRATGLAAIALALAAGMVVWVVVRAVRPLRERGLALVLERCFPELRDALLTTVEPMRGGTPSVATRTMLAQTAKLAAQQMKSLPLEGVLDPQPLRRAIWTAGGALLAIVGLGVAHAASLERWSSGYLSLEDQYWPRIHHLVVGVLAQPDDRFREFIDGEYRHPRGEDLQLVVSPQVDTPAPERLRLAWRTMGGGWRRTALTQLGHEPFRHTIPAVLDDVELWVTGGDFSLQRALRVRVVDPPGIGGLTAQVTYPEYTGLNAVESLRQLTVTSGELALPMESDVELTATSTKPLQAIRWELETGGRRWTWSIDRSRAGVLALEPTAEHAGWQTAIPEAWKNGLLSADGLTLRASFVIRAAAAAVVEEQIAPPVGAMRIDDRAMLKLTLEDTDGVRSLEPWRLRLLGVVDQPPLVQTQLRGIGAAITTRARIPVAGRLTDDYGVAGGEFGYRVDVAAEWMPRSIEGLPSDRPKMMELARSPQEPYARFEVGPLELKTKQKLWLTVKATDADDFHGPHATYGQTYTFLIVSNEELLLTLYARETNLRRRFEQLLADLTRVRGDMAGLGPKLAAVKDDSARSGIEISLVRGLQDVRKNTNENAAIAISFADLRDELVNNGVETPAALDRLERKIITPLRRVNEQRFPTLDRRLGELKVAWDQKRLTAADSGDLAGQFDEVLSELRAVLAEMRKQETVQEALELLRAIIDAQNEVLEATKKQRKANALKALEE